jgi:integrase
MKAFNYTLTPTRINNAKPKPKVYKISDAGGLFVEISTLGLKSWRYQYRLDGKRNTVTIGKYPEIGVADARDRHFEFSGMVTRGEDPATARRIELEQRKKKSVADGETVESFSSRWISERLGTKSATYRKQMESLLERFVWPEIGSMRLMAVKPANVLQILEMLRKTPYTAELVRKTIQYVFNYAIQKLLVEVNPALPLRGFIEVPAAEHHRHLSEAELARFWRSVEKQGAHFHTIAATKILMYSMLRKSEVIKAKWKEFDLADGHWDIPKERMKMKRPHRVYLSRQALEVLEILKALDVRGEYVFPSVLLPGTHLGEATLNHFFGRLDFGVDEFSPHGTRGTAATLLREHGFSREVVELLLAHTEKGVAASYHHHELADERRRALQYLADQIDRLADQERTQAHGNRPAHNEILEKAQLTCSI